MIRVSYSMMGNPDLDDKELSAILNDALGTTFYKFVEATQEKVREAIGKAPDSIYVRCHRSDRPKVGFAFRTGKSGIPDIILGFCGDVKDLEITLIHELLHILRWDEMMVEAKAGEIYRRSK